MSRVQSHLEARIVDPGWSSEPGREWLAEAACDGMPISLFYPVHDEDCEAAKRVCGGCPVRSDCLAEALALPSWFADHGVWGGTSPTERKRMRGDEQTVCRNGHPRTDENTRRVTSGWTCRDCRAEADRRRRGVS